MWLSLRNNINALLTMEKCFEKFKWNVFFGILCRGSQKIHNTIKTPPCIFRQLWHNGTMLICRQLFIQYFDFKILWWTYSELFWAIWSYLELFCSILSYLELFGAIWSHLEQFGPFLTFLIFLIFSLSLHLTIFLHFLSGLLQGFSKTYHT